MHLLDLQKYITYVHISHQETLIHLTISFHPKTRSFSTTTGGGGEEWTWMQSVMVEVEEGKRVGDGAGGISVAARSAATFWASWNWVQVSAGILAGTCVLLVFLQLVAWVVT